MNVLISEKHAEMFNVETEEETMNILSWVNLVRNAFSLSLSLLVLSGSVYAGFEVECQMGNCPIKVNQIAAGGYHTCALLQNSRVKCWGNNEYGQLGIGNYDFRGSDPNDMGNNLPQVDLHLRLYSISSGIVSQITAGQEHTCALLDSGDVKCWGNNEYGQLGQGDMENRGDELDEMGSTLSTIKLGGFTVVQIAAGDHHTCALFKNGRMKCWGRNNVHQLGIFFTTDSQGDGTGEMGSNLPFVNPGNGVPDADSDYVANLGFGVPLTNWLIDETTTPDLKIIQISAGNDNTCALLKNGHVKCWGDNYAGQLGQEVADEIFILNGDQLPHIKLGQGRTVTQIVTSSSKHNCALFANYDVKCWGGNSYGQLGLGLDTINRYYQGDEEGEMGGNLATVALTTYFDYPTQLTAGNNHNCALYNTGKIRCWGQGWYGKLGLGDTSDRGDEPNEMGTFLPFVDLGTNRTAIQIVTGSSHTCALLDNGRVKCWGNNGWGTLGLGDTNDRGDDANEMADYLPYVDIGTQ